MTNTESEGYTVLIPFKIDEKLAIKPGLGLSWIIPEDNPNEIRSQVNPLCEELVKKLMGSSKH